MTQRDEFLVFARMMVTPTNQLGARKGYMSPETQQRFEEFRKAFESMVDSARDDLITEQTVLSAKRALQQDAIETQEMKAHDSEG